MRLAHISDLHIDERNRLDDTMRVLAAFIAQARDAQVDAILIAGDFFERRSTPAERNALADFLLDCAGVAPVVGVRGNHDAEGDLDIFNYLPSVRIWNRPSVAPGSARGVAGSVVPLAVLTLPWFSKVALAASLPAETSADETTARTIEAAGALLTCIRAEAERCRRNGLAPILIGHVQVAGSETSTGQTMIGQSVELSPGDLGSLGCAYVALGHIHKRQNWGAVHYSGSPNRCNFGEPEAKGWNLVTIENGELACVEFMELPAQRIVLIERDWSNVDATDDLGAPAHSVVPDDEDVRDALVRVRYRICPQHLDSVDEAAIERDLRSAGAIEVKLEAVLVHQARVRSVEITTAADTWAKLEAYWAAAGIVVPKANRLRISSKLDEIETRQRQEVRDAA